MSRNYKDNVAKWMPLRTPPTINKFFTNSLILSVTMDGLQREIVLYLKNITKTDSYNHVNLKHLTKKLELLILSCKIISEPVEPENIIYKYKVKYLIFELKRKINIIVRLVSDLINETCRFMIRKLLIIIFRLINVYNELLSLDHGYDSSVNIFYNDCSDMLESLKKLSLTRILQILAENHTKEYCDKLLHLFLSNYRCNSNDIEKFTVNIDMDVPQYSSIEIYRSLTKRFTSSSIKITDHQEPNPNLENVHDLVKLQNKQIVSILKVIRRISPYLLHPNTTEKENGNKNRITIFLDNVELTNSNNNKTVFV